MSACDSSETEEATPEVGNIIPIPACNVVTSTAIEDGSTEVTTYTYHESGYPKSQSFTDTRNVDGQEEVSVWMDVYEFEGDKVIKLIEKNADGSIFAERAFTWEGDRITKVTKTFNEEGDDYIEEYRYEYTGDNVTKITYWDGEKGSELSQWGVDVIQWENGNVVSLEYTDLDEVAGGRYAERRKATKNLIQSRVEGTNQNTSISYEYDDKNNPYPFIGYVYTFWRDCKINSV